MERYDGRQNKKIPDFDINSADQILNILNSSMKEDKETSNQQSSEYLLYVYTPPSVKPPKFPLPTMPKTTVENFEENFYKKLLSIWELLL